MRTLEQTFHELTALIADQTRDLAMAMAELRSVAAERDKALASLKDAGFTLADGAERWKPPVNERMGELYRRLFALTDERDNLSEALERNCVQYVQKQQTLIAARQIAVAGWNAATIERDHARQSLRAAEADVAETESVNSDLRTVNARLVADLAAATQRADTAEAILRAKA